MIDEKKELEEYTCAIGPQMPRRILYLNFTNKLAGVKRALVVIARYCLFDKGLDAEQTIQILKSWCGFIPSLPDAIREMDKGFFTRIDDWLPKYIIQMEADVASDEKKIEKIKETTKLLAPKKDNWDYDPFFADGKRNDKNALTFTAIVAEALNEGPLRTRVLTFAKPPKAAMVLPKRGSQEGKKKLFIMSIAAYCAKATPGRRKIHLDQPAFSNWVGEGCPNGKRVKETLEALSFKCGKDLKPLFHFQNIGSESVNFYKMVLNDDFIKEYQPKVMTVDEFRALPEEDRDRLCVYTDLGCNVLMQEGTGWLKTAP